MLRIEGFGLGSWRRRKGHATSKEAYRSESLFGIDHSLDSVVHILDEVDFSAAESESNPGGVPGDSVSESTATKAQRDKRHKRKVPNIHGQSNLKVAR